jgi:hypothetical protein
MARNFPLYTKKEVFNFIGYKPFYEQWLVHNSKARFKTVRSGRRLGKSILAAMDNFDLIYTPNTRGWIVAPTYNLGEKEWRYIIDALYGGPSFPQSQLKHLILDTIKKSDNLTQGQMYLKILWKPIKIKGWTEKQTLAYFSKPTEILVKSYEKGIESLWGEEIDWAIASEGAKMKREVWERGLRMTLTSRQGRLIIPSTSADGSDLMDEFYQKGQQRTEPNYASWEFPAYCNPHWAENIEEEIEECKRNMTLEAFEEQVLGKRVHYTGRYYKEFDSQKHIAPLNLDRSREVHRSWDFGYRHPAIGWFQINRKDQIHWLYTYLGTDMDDLDIALMGKYLSGEIPYKALPLNYPVAGVKIQNIIKKEGLIPFIKSENKMEFYDYCDASGTQYKSSTGSAIAILNGMGIDPYYTAEKIHMDEDEPPSIQIVRATLKIRPNGDPNLLIDVNNTLASNMFRNLAYEKKQDGSKSHKYKKEGYHEHSHDLYKYFVLHTFKYLLVSSQRPYMKQIAYA